MSSNKTNLKYALPIILSLLAVGGYHFFLRADPPSKVYFTNDTVLSLSGINDGELLIAQGSECDSVDIAGGNATITIPDGKSLTLKTSKHTEALKITASGGNVSVEYAGSDFLSGDITGFTLSDSLGLTSADIVWGVPSAQTVCEVKQNGSVFDSYLSDSSSKISFSSGTLAAAKAFTLEIDTAPSSTGGSAPIHPAAPDTSEIRFFVSSDSELDFRNLPENITQIAISTDPEFEDASWEAIAEAEKLMRKFNYADKLYVKFRTKSGGVSEVIEMQKSALPKFAKINEGEIVKTAASPDVYIIKYKNGKQYKRLILSPRVFESYEHLKWENIRIISQVQMDDYATSTLVQVAGDSIIYELSPDGDTGTKKIVSPPRTYDADSVYEINAIDRDSYELMR